MADDDKHSNETAVALAALIAQHFNLDLSSGEGALLDRGLSFDSVALIQLIVLLEEHFGIGFEEDELRMESFTDLRSLSALVGEKIRRRA